MRNPLTTRMARPIRQGFLALMVVSGLLLAFALGAFLAQPARTPVQTSVALSPTAPTFLSADAHRRLLSEQSYLRAQVRLAVTATTPEQVGIARYLRAHGAHVPLPAAARSMTPDERAVFDYLRAHGW